MSKDKSLKITVSDDGKEATVHLRRPGRVEKDIVTLYLAIPTGDHLVITGDGTLAVIPLGTNEIKVRAL